MQGAGVLQADDGDKVIAEQSDEHNDGDTTNSEAPAPGPFSQIFGNTGQFLQNIIQPTSTEQPDDDNDGDANKSEAPAPGPIGQIFGNTGQFLQNFIQG